LLQYSIVGLVVGGIYAIAAVGLVSTYVSAGVLNFAYGSLAFFIARLYYFLHTQHGWSIAAAGVVSIVVVGPALGILLWAGLFRYLAQSSTLTKVVVTIGLSVAVPPLASVLFGDQAIPGAPGLAPEPVHVFHFDGVPVTLDQLLVLAVTALLIGVGFLVLRFSPAGLVVRAVVDSRSMAALVGVNPQVVAASVWALSILLAGLAGVLMAPIIGLTSANFVLLVAAAFSAVVVARFRSLGVAVLAALVLGWVGAMAQKYLPPASSVTQNILPAIPFAFVIVFLVVYSLRGGHRPERTPPAELAKMLFAERQVRRPARKGTGGGLIGLRTRAAANPGAALLMLGVAVLPLVLRGLWVGLVGQGAALGVVFLSYTLVTGEGGFLSLCQISLAGLGAIAAAQLASVYGVPVLLACAIGALAVVPVGAVIGLLTLRLGDLYVALVTLTIGLVVENVVFNLPRFFNQGQGVSLARPDFASGDRAYTYLMLAGFGLAAVAVVRFRSSSAGLALGAVRWSEPGARTIGVGVVRSKLLGLMAASSLAGLGGSLYALYGGSVTGSNYSTFEGLVWLSVVVAAGIRPVSGALVAGITFTVLPAVVQQYLPTAWGNVPPILFGLGAIGVVRQPSGWILALASRLERKPGPADAPAVVLPSRRAVASRPRPAVGDAPAVLEAAGIIMRFGGTTALDGVTLSVPAGGALGLIGPNGAGKSSLFGVLSGLLDPTAGAVHMGGEDVTALSAEARAHRGLARTFQLPELFATLTVRDHLLLAYRARHSPGRQWSDLIRLAGGRETPGESEHIDELLGALGLGESGARLAAGLPLAVARRVEVGRALATAPTVLLLDEPSSGLDREEAARLAEVLGRARDSGVAMVVVEHDVDFVLGLASEVMVLDHGVVIARGDGPGIRSDDAVRLAYLGQSAAQPR